MKKLLLDLAMFSSAAICVLLVLTFAASNYFPALVVAIWAAALVPWAWHLRKAEKR